MALKQDLSEYHDLVAKSLVTLDRDVARLEDRSSNLAATQTDLRKNFDVFRTRELAMKDEVLALNKTVSSIERQIDGIGHLLEKLTQEVSRVNGETEGMYRDVQELSQWHDQAKPRLSGLVNDVDGQKGLQKALAGRLSSLEDAQRRAVAFPQRIAFLSYLSLLVSIGALVALGYVATWNM